MNRFKSTFLQYPSIFSTPCFCIMMCVFLSSQSSGAEFVTAYPQSQLRGLNGWHVQPLFTVGEVLPSTDQRFPGNYQPPGVLDGIGAFRLDATTVRILVNHELHRNQGYPYTLKNGTELVGARISFLDLDTDTRRIINSGLAYETVIDRQFEEVRHPAQINEDMHPQDGFSNFCSGNLVGVSGPTAFVDPVYFTHEENTNTIVNRYGGTLWALEVDRKILHAIPSAGRLNWENTTELSVHKGYVALLIGDDFTPRTLNGKLIGAPLWLYLGKKNASWYEIRQQLPGGIYPSHDHFLNRNGLLIGKLFFFVPDGPMKTPETFHGTGNVMKGSWHELPVFEEDMAGKPGYDQVGYKDGLVLRKEAKAGGAFQFSRPEDVSTHPFLRDRAVFISTGYGSQFNGADNWGTVYQVDVDFPSMRGKITILYDADDAGGGRVPAPDFGIRNPDNVTWASDGMIYLQEDDASQNEPFGQRSGQEASIWQFNPSDSRLTRIAQIDRTVILPPGSTDNHPADIGDWESSGLIDVTSLFSTKFGERIFLADVQAHGIRDGLITRKALVQGGQLLFLFRPPF